MRLELDRLQQLGIVYQIIIKNAFAELSRSLFTKKMALYNK